MQDHTRDVDMAGWVIRAVAYRNAQHVSPASSSSSLSSADAPDSWYKGCMHIIWMCCAHTSIRSRANLGSGPDLKAIVLWIWLDLEPVIYLRKRYDTTLHMREGEGEENRMGRMRTQSHDGHCYWASCERANHNSRTSDNTHGWPMGIEFGMHDVEDLGSEPCTLNRFHHPPGHLAIQFTLFYVCLRYCVVH